MNYARNGLLLLYLVTVSWLPYLLCYTPLSIYYIFVPLHTSYSQSLLRTRLRVSLTYIPTLFITYFYSHSYIIYNRFVLTQSVTISLPHPFFPFYSYSA